MSKRIPSAVNSAILASEPGRYNQLLQKQVTDTFGTRTESPVSNAYLVCRCANRSSRSASLLSVSSKSVNDRYEDHIPYVVAIQRCRPRGTDCCSIDKTQSLSACTTRNAARTASVCAASMPNQSAAFRAASGEPRQIMLQRHGAEPMRDFT